VSEGVAILTSTSYLDEAERCHRVGLLYRGRMLYCDEPEELKRQFRGGVLAIRSADPASIRNVVSASPLARGSLLVGDRVHLFVDDATRRVPEVRALLDATGLSYESVEPVAASIEDLFVSAVEGGLGGASGKEPR
jgi:ABC-2 type transport system ATP-binding protein